MPVADHPRRTARLDAVARGAQRAARIRTALRLRWATRGPADGAEIAVVEDIAMPRQRALDHAENDHAAVTHIDGELIARGLPIDSSRVELREDARINRTAVDVTAAREE